MLTHIHLLCKYRQNLSVSFTKKKKRLQLWSETTPS